jgi:nucleoside-diphosphate-sugar epimerase
VIIRPFTIIGEQGRKEMVIYKWLNQYLSGRPISFYGDGSTFRGYTYIADMIEGVKLCLDEKIQREDFNLGGHQKISLSELLDIFKELFPDVEVQRQEMPKSDQPYSFADTSKAEKMLGWKPAEDTKDKIRALFASESRKK